MIKYFYVMMLFKDILTFILYGMCFKRELKSSLV